MLAGKSQKPVYALEERHTIMGQREEK